MGSFISYVEEAKKRGFTPERCNNFLGTAAKIEAAAGEGDLTICRKSTIDSGRVWAPRSAAYWPYLSEAQRRRLTLAQCRQLIAQQRSYSPVTAAVSKDSVGRLSNKEICRTATAGNATGWEQRAGAYASYIDEARRRGLSLDDCKVALGYDTKKRSSPNTGIASRSSSAGGVKPRVDDKIVALLRKKNKNAVAVIVGNRDYAEGLPKVDYAVRDADAFKAFLTGALGYDGENIVDLRDATKAQMETAFGNERTHEGRLWRYLDPQGKSDVMVFYSGHGVPGLKDRRGYLLPVNADANSPEINGYPIDLLLENLAKLEARSIAVFLDACFSGNSAKGMLINATSGITISARMPEQTHGNLVVLSAAKGDQVASWDTEAKHGLFTRYLMEALYGKADSAEYGDGDGKVTLAEVKSYLDDRMTRRARRLWGRHQNADMRGDGATVLAAGVASDE